MELKLVILVIMMYYLICFNRTFMELKYKLLFLILLDHHVLIVPLWN